jgi:hypothetical protein
MFINKRKVIWDQYLEMLTGVLRVLDRELATILDGWQDATEEADALGYFDRAEHITGLGFVACQAYMTATYGRRKIQKILPLPLVQSIAQDNAAFKSLIMQPITGSITMCVGTIIEAKSAVLERDIRDSELNRYDLS